MQDVKFVQAEVTQFTDLTVVSRYKRDFLVMPKKGGKISSSVDSRVTFVAERGMFKKPENFVLQVNSHKHLLQNSLSGPPNFVPMDGPSNYDRTLIS